MKYLYIFVINITTYYAFKSKSMAQVANLKLP